MDTKLLSELLEIKGSEEQTVMDENNVDKKLPGELVQITSCVLDHCPKYFGVCEEDQSKIGVAVKVVPPKMGGESLSGKRRKNLPQNLHVQIFYNEFRTETVCIQNI